MISFTLYIKAAQINPLALAGLEDRDFEKESVWETDRQTDRQRESVCVIWPAQTICACWCTGELSQSVRVSRASPSPRTRTRTRTRTRLTDQKVYGETPRTSTTSQRRYVNDTAQKACTYW